MTTFVERSIVGSSPFALTAPRNVTPENAAVAIQTPACAMNPFVCYTLAHEHSFTQGVYWAMCGRGRWSVVSPQLGASRWFWTLGAIPFLSAGTGCGGGVSVS